MKKKHGFFLMYLIILLFFAYRYFPTVVFYFDQTEGVATVTMVDKYKVSFEYNHQKLDKKIKLSTKIRNIKKVSKIKKGDEIPILYSSRFSHIVSLQNLNGKPSLWGVILLIICALPVVFINRLGFED